MVGVVRAALAVSGLLLVLASPAAAQTYPPSTNSWVYDFAEAMSAADEAEITDLFKTLEAETAVDAVAVAINSVGDYHPGARLEDFAKGLFNHWQLGDVGIDDGVLLVVAVRDRQARVTIGDGFDDSFVAEAQEVIDSMLPSFRAGDYSGGIKTGAREIASRFRSLDGTAGDDPSGASGSPSGGGSADMFEEVADEDSPDGGGGIPGALWYAVGGGGAALFGAGGFVTWQRIKPRKCQQCSREMKRLKGRKAEQPHLQAGQNLEEQLDSVEYDVFACVSCGASKIERHGKLFSGYKKCPECAFRTMSTSRRTIRMATYDSGGTDRITKDCRQCGYHHEYEVSTPKKTRPSSRTGFRSGGGSSGPSGGGRSSGRGASGSW